jgi:hypothetical protein
MSPAEYWSPPYESGFTICVTQRATDMTAIQQSLNCGAVDCELSAGVRVFDAGMEFVRCPACRVLHIPPENLGHSTVLPDRVEKLSIVMKILLSMRMRWLRKELPQLRDKNAVILIGSLATRTDLMQQSCATEIMNTKYFLGLTQLLRQ